MILILGCGALGSNVAMNLAYDLPNEDLNLLDFDRVEPRNYQFGTQQYIRQQEGQTKVEALSFNIYKAVGRYVSWQNRKIESANDLVRIESSPITFVINCFDNYQARKIVKEYADTNKVACLHAGFSPQMTFEATWNENYVVPEDVHSDFDICEMPGARAFITEAAAIVSSIVVEYHRKGDKLEVVGNRFQVTKII